LDVIRVAHISDTHIGYEAYRAVAPNGENQRSVDVARAFARNVEEIVAWDPPLVVHSGDVAERPHIPVRAMLFVRQQLMKLAGVRADGTRRQVVVIAGNHELPSRRNEACFLELFRDLPGVTVVCDRYERVVFSGGDVPVELRDVVVHAVPHDTWKDLTVEDALGEIAPVPGKVNVLLGHGVAGGSQLYKRVLGREFAIPTDVLNQDWEYGALGHWHKRGPVGGAAGTRVWYAGSTENMGFGDLVDNETTRGHLRVTLHPGELPSVEHVAVPTRAMHRLRVLDGTGLDPAAIAQALRERIAEAKRDGRLAGAVVGQVVTGVPRDVWALVDVTGVRDSADGALHYELTVKPVSVEEGAAPKREPNAGILELLEEVAGTVVRDDAQRVAAVDMARGLLRAHLEHVEDDDAEGGENEKGAGEKSESGTASVEVAS
jgi:DNA repair exonuclease SbcCD nuclease subunit